MKFVPDSLLRLSLPLNSVAPPCFRPRLVRPSNYAHPPARPGSKPGRRLILPKALTHTPPTPASELRITTFTLSAQKFRSVDISRTLIIRVAEEAEDAEEDSFGGLDGAPAFGLVLVPVLVALGLVQDRDADFARRVHVRVEGHGRLEDHFRWHHRVCWREEEVCAEVASWEGGEGGCVSM